MTDSEFQRRYGSWAVVAGASMGMGAEYSRQLAAKGLNVLMLAEAAEPLMEVAAEIARTHRVETRTAVVDLSVANLVDIVSAEAAGLDVGMFVYNAAHSVVGRFLNVPIAERLKMIDVNVRGVLLLCDYFARRFVERGRGGLIVMSSMSGFQGQAMVGTYAATKAFDLVLAESLWDELKGTGVDVLAFCPGATRTPAYLATQPKQGGVLSPPTMSPAATVAEAIAAIGKGPTAIAGRNNRISAFILSHLIPRRARITLMSRATRGMYDG